MAELQQATPIRTNPSRQRREPEIHQNPTQARPVMADLEEEADALLGRHLIISRYSDIYSDNQLNRKMREERKRLPTLTEHSVPDEVTDYLVEAQTNDLIDAANLTALQEIIYRLFVSGFSIRDIAKALGRKNGTIFERLNTVMGKIRTAYEEGRYSGWYEVYLSEVRRGR